MVIGPHRGVSMFRTFLSSLIISTCVLIVSPRAEAEDIPIGVAGPLTGQLGVFGEQLLRGAEMAVQDINAAGGIDGKQLRLEIGDDQCDPMKAVQVANDLIKKGVVFVDGHFCDGASIQASEVYAEAGILQITPASGAPELTAKEIPTLFRMVPPDNKLGAFAGLWLATNYGSKKIAILDDQSAYAQGLAEVAERNLNGLGIKATLRATFKPGETDFSSLISEMKAAQVDVVYVSGYPNDVGLMVRQAREQGLKADFVAGNPLDPSAFWSSAGPAGEGVRFFAPASPVYFESAKEVVAHFREAKFEPDGYTLMSYAAVQAFAAAAKATKSTDGKTMAEWLRESLVDTVLGPMTWDSKGDLQTATYTTRTIHDGKATEDPADNRDCTCGNTTKSCDKKIECTTCCNSE